MDGCFDEFLDDLKDKDVELFYGEGEAQRGRLVGYSRYGVTLDWEYKLDFENDKRSGRMLFAWGSIKNIMEVQR